MAEGPRRWSLFIDETGSLDGRERSLLGGLLVQAGDVRSWTEPLRADVEAIVAPTPWPCHTVLLNRPSFHVLSSVVWGEASSPEGCALAPAAAWLKQGRPALWKVLARKMQQGEEPDRAGLLDLDRTLGRAPKGVKRPAYDRRELVRVQLALAVGTLSERLQREVHVVGSVVRKAEDRRPVGLLAATPWTCALRSLIQRVHFLVGAPTGQAIIQVRVANRRTHFAGAAREVHITGPILRAAIREATAQFPWRERIVWEVPHHRVDDKSPTAHPVLILADFALNRSLGTVRNSADMDGATLVEQLRHHRATGMGRGAPVTMAPPWHAEEALPTLDHVGAPNALWMSAVTKEPLAPWTETTCWGQEQADRWKQALTSGVLE